MAAFANMTTRPVVDFCFGFMFAYAASTKHVMVASVGNDGKSGRLSGKGIGGSVNVPSGILSSGRIFVLQYRKPHVLVRRRYRATPFRYLKCKSEGANENLDMVETAKPMSGRQTL